MPRHPQQFLREDIVATLPDADFLLRTRHRWGAWLADTQAPGPLVAAWKWVLNDDRAGIIGIAILALLLALLAIPLLLRAPALTGDKTFRPQAATLAPAAVDDFPSLLDLPLPAVDPVELIKVDAATARRINAGVPFITGPNPAAAPYHTALTGDDLQRATDCLAAAEIYEAGNDPLGEAAVAQVVLNRVRHPAFPDSVCGVVFQGSDRSTGCQFSFTCDGSMARHPRPDIWSKARDIATLALTGTVFARVGLATHYHTDWVVPKWSAQLDKLTEVHTHLFFRWRGPWGTPGAFRRESLLMEPQIDKLAFLSDVHKRPEALAALRLERVTAGMEIRRDGNMVLVGFNSAIPPEALPALASSLCGGNEDCRVLGWQDRHHMPAGRPDSEAINHAVFTFSRSRGDTVGVSRWNCSVYTTQTNCLSETPVVATATEAIKPTTAPVIANAAPVADTNADPGTVSQPVPARHPRVDPCRAMRNVDDRIGFCANR